jgi:hypothetical protein
MSFSLPSNGDLLTRLKSGQWCGAGSVGTARPRRVGNTRIAAKEGANDFGGQVQQ